MASEHDEPPAMEELARRYLDMWQDQWAAVCADPAVADSLARTMTAFGQTAMTLNGLFEQAMGPATTGNPWADMMKSFWTNSSGTKGADGHDKRQETGGVAGTKATAPGAASPRPASGDGDGDVALLAERIAALERELAALAPDGEANGGAPAPQPASASGRRRKSARKPPAD